MVAAKAAGMVVAEKVKIQLSGESEGYVEFQAPNVSSDTTYEIVYRTKKTLLDSTHEGVRGQLEVKEQPIAGQIAVSHTVTTPDAVMAAYFQMGPGVLTTENDTIGVWLYDEADESAPVVEPVTAGTVGQGVLAFAAPSEPGTYLIKYRNASEKPAVLTGGAFTVVETVIPTAAEWQSTIDEELLEKLRQRLVKKFGVCDDLELSVDYASFKEEGKERYEDGLGAFALCQGFYSTQPALRAIAILPSQMKALFKGFHWKNGHRHCSVDDSGIVHISAPWHTYVDWSSVVDDFEIHSIFKSWAESRLLKYEDYEKKVELLEDVCAWPELALGDEGSIETLKQVLAAPCFWQPDAATAQAIRVCRCAIPPIEGEIFIKCWNVVKVNGAGKKQERLLYLTTAQLVNVCFDYKKIKIDHMTSYPLANVKWCEIGKQIKPLPEEKKENKKTAAEEKAKALKPPSHKVSQKREYKYDNAIRIWFQKGKKVHPLSYQKLNIVMDDSVIEKLKSKAMSKLKSTVETVGNTIVAAVIEEDPNTKEEIRTEFSKPLTDEQIPLLPSYPAIFGVDTPVNAELQLPQSLLSGKFQDVSNSWKFAAYDAVFLGAPFKEADPFQVCYEYEHRIDIKKGSNLVYSGMDYPYISVKHKEEARNALMWEVGLTLTAARVFVRHSAVEPCFWYNIVTPSGGIVTSIYNGGKFGMKKKKAPEDDNCSVEPTEEEQRKYGEPAPEDGASPTPEKPDQDNEHSDDDKGPEEEEVEVEVEGEQTSECTSPEPAATPVPAPEPEPAVEESVPEPEPEPAAEESVPEPEPEPEVKESVPEPEPEPEPEVPVE
jgi:hypothetical protein